VYSNDVFNQDKLVQHCFKESIFFALILITWLACYSIFLVRRYVLFILSASAYFYRITSQ